MSAQRAPVQENLFLDSDPPRLLGGRCKLCQEPHFPRHDTCPYCASAEVVPIELTGPGRLWAWTAVTAPPPGYQGRVPYGFGVVELDEGLRIVTRLAEGNPAALHQGQCMQLRIVPLEVDGATADVDAPTTVTFAFAPEAQA